ncbi:MAG: DUF6364 family protein [Saprospiraceae bacterium]
MKNLTLSIPDELLEKSRAYAEQHGTSLNEFVRTLLRRYVMNETEQPIDNLLKKAEEFAVSTKSWKWDRDELYDRKIFS